MSAPTQCCALVSACIQMSHEALRRALRLDRLSSPSRAVVPVVVVRRTRRYRGPGWERSRTIAPHEELCCGGPQFTHLVA